MQTKPDIKHEHCWNNRKPIANRYIARDRLLLSCGYWLDIEVFIQNRMTTQCGQRKGMEPPGCNECSHLGIDK